jgi:hypothetical protein
MAFSVRESIHVNTLLLWLLGQTNASGRRVLDGEARQAAESLAEKAYFTLSAGLTGTKVDILWQEAAPRPAIRPTLPPNGARPKPKKGPK